LYDSLIKIVANNKLIGIFWNIIGLFVIKIVYLRGIFKMNFKQYQGVRIIVDLGNRGGR